MDRRLNEWIEAKNELGQSDSRHVTSQASLRTPHVTHYGVTLHTTVLPSAGYWCQINGCEKNLYLYIVYTVYNTSLIYRLLHRGQVSNSIIIVHRTNLYRRRRRRRVLLCYFWLLVFSLFYAWSLTVLRKTLQAVDVKNNFIKIWTYGNPK